MFSVPNYSQTFTIHGPFGNNQIDFEKRERLKPNPSIKVPSLIECSNLSEAKKKLKKGNQIAFEIYDDNQTLSFNGLSNFVIFPNPFSPKNPIIIFDNHNHAFYFWLWYKHISKPINELDLIHIDQHKDSRVPDNLLTQENCHDLNKVFEYTNYQLNVGNFIPPAQNIGLIKTIINIDSSHTLNQALQQTAPPSPFILDIDLDFFSPEMNYLDNAKKIELICKLLPQAEITTIATSPYFIDHHLAAENLWEIFSP